MGSQETVPPTLNFSPTQTPPPTLHQPLNPLMAHRAKIHLVPDADVQALEHLANGPQHRRHGPAQAIHAEVITLRTDLVNVKEVLNAVIDDLQAVGFTT